MQNLNSFQIGIFSNKLLHEGGLSAKTVKDILLVLRGIFQYEEKPPISIPHIEIIYPREENKEMRFLTIPEEQKMVNYLCLNMDRCKFGDLLALMTGLRIGEICALRWCEISISDGVLCVGATIQRLKNTDRDTGAKTKTVISAPKSDTSRRLIPLSGSMRDLCERYYGDPDAFILTGDQNKLCEPRTMQRKIKQYAKACNLDGVHFHTLRHSFATRCVEAGFDMKTLSEVLGHASSEVTLKRHVHSSLELKRQNMEKLSAIIF